MIDRHPIARNWIHWCVVNIPSTTTEIPEGASLNRSILPPGTIELRNSYGELGYGGPQPPPGSGVHEYVITLYALAESTPDLRDCKSLDACRRRIEGRVLEMAEIVGIFER
jgi:Raf kinase inhibitor-like YbhB/YbcL family protein